MAASIRVSVTDIIRATMQPGGTIRVDLRDLRSDEIYVLATLVLLSLLQPDVPSALACCVNENHGLSEELSNAREGEYGNNKHLSLSSSGGRHISVWILVDNRGRIGELSSTDNFYRNSSCAYTAYAGIDLLLTSLDSGSCVSTWLMDAILASWCLYIVCRVWAEWYISSVVGWITECL